MPKGIVGNTENVKSPVT